MSERVCVVGAGVIGSLFAGHLAQVADVCVLTRRREHADALNAQGPSRHRPERPARSHHRVGGSGQPPSGRSRHRRDEGDRAGSGGGDARRAIRGCGRDDGAQRPRRGGRRPRPRRLADHLCGHLHERYEALRHAHRVHPRHGDLAGPVRGDAAFERVGEIGNAARPGRPEGRSAARPPPSAVVEADLQRDRQLRRRADRPSARRPFRRPRPVRRISGDSSSTSSRRARRWRLLRGSRSTTTPGR